MSRIYRLHQAPRGGPALDYHGLLNDQQVAVVEAPAGPILVVAGAGSGKTRTLTWRVARLLHDGVSPESILLLTFTNKAAREMLRRVEEVARVDTRRLTGGTFHHVAHQVLREHAEALGYARGYSILDREDADDVMTAAVADCGLAVGARRFPKADVLVDLVSHGHQHPDAARRGGGRRAGRSSCRSPTSCCGWPAASPSGSAT